jgi:hypothetical protein
MKLLVGGLSYLLVVGTLLAATFAGIFSVERTVREGAPVLAHGHVSDADRRAMALQEAKVDPDRTPVWIVPTTKYEYTPVAITQPKPRAVIGARAAVPERSYEGVRAINSALRDRDRGRRSAMGFAPAHRDNDPFYRD